MWVNEWFCCGSGDSVCGVRRCMGAVMADNRLPLLDSNLCEEVWRGSSQLCFIRHFSIFYTTECHSKLTTGSQHRTAGLFIWTRGWWDMWSRVMWSQYWKKLDCQIKPPSGILNKPEKPSTVLFFVLFCFVLSITFDLCVIYIYI